MFRKYIKNGPKMGLSSICNPKIFFKYWALSLVYSYGALTMVSASFFSLPLKWKVPLVVLPPLNPLKGYCAPCERVPLQMKDICVPP